MKPFIGTVIHGQKIAQTLGYPTANLDVPREQIKLRAGVYAAEATIGEHTYGAALVLIDQPKKVEVYLLDIHEDLYGKRVAVRPFQKVSEIEKHDSVESLQKKIAADIDLVRGVLSGNA